MIPLNNSVFKIIKTLNLIKKRKFAFFEILNKFKKSQYHQIDDLKKLQIKKLKQLINYSYNDVPYYHRLFKENNLYPTDINTFNDLKKIPILTKEIIQTNLNEMISTEYEINKLYKNYTGGSTGNPIVFYQCNNYLNHADAGRILAWYIFPGFDYGARTALLWGASRDIRVSQPFLYRLRKYFDGMITMNSHKMNERKFEIFLKNMIKFKPFILRGYPSVLFQYSNYIEKNQKKLIDLSSIITSGEVLHEFQRKKMEDIFNCHILDSYGCREVSQIAMECKQHNGMHIIMENQIVEILNSNEEVSTNETGDIIVTNLNNYGMPFIRYKVGDRARRSSIDKCHCKRGFELIDSIVGREQGFITTPGKNYINEAFFGYRLAKIVGIREYQIIQNKIDEIIILIVGDEKQIGNQINIILSDMIAELDENIHFEIKYVDKIEKTKTGKYRMLVSNF